MIKISDFDESVTVISVGLIVLVSALVIYLLASLIMPDRF